MLDRPTSNSTALDRAEQMLALAHHCQTLAEGEADPRALQIIQMNWLGFAIGTAKLPQACLALYRLFLAWGIPEQSALAMLEPGICYLDEVIDDTGEGSTVVHAWVQSSRSNEDDQDARRHLQSVTDGLECLFLVAAKLLEQVPLHDPGLIQDFVYPAHRWSRLGSEALAEAHLDLRWPSHADLSTCLDQLAYGAASAPVAPSSGFYGLPFAGVLPSIRLNERLSTRYTGAVVSPFFRDDRFSFDAFLKASQSPIEHFLIGDSALLHSVTEGGGPGADFHALAESYYDRMEDMKAGDADSPWDETRSLLFLRALSCRALAVVFQKSWGSVHDLHTLLANYAESEEQDAGVTTATALLVFAPLASVIDEALRVTVDGETVQLRVWVDAFRSTVPEEHTIARAYLQQTRFAWISLCRMLSDGKQVLLDLAGPDRWAELLPWVDDRIEDLLALADLPDMSFLLGEERDERGHHLRQARSRYRLAAKKVSTPSESPRDSRRDTSRPPSGEAGHSEPAGAGTPSTGNALIQVVDAKLFDNYADSKSIKEYWSLKKAERLKAGLALLPATINGIGTLRQEFPWFEEVIEFIELWVARNAALGIADCRLPPLLLVGGYGCGKTYFGRRLAEIQNLPFRLLPAGGSSDNRQLMGTSRGWGTAFPALPVDFMADTGVANGFIVIDEIDKESEDRRNGRLSDTLLQLLEPANSKNFMDPFLGCPVDCRYLQWLLTANSLSGINKALLSRVRLFAVEQPKKEHYPRLAQQIRIGFAREHQVDVRLLPHLDGDDLDRIQKHCRSVREVRQATEWTLTRKIVAEKGGAVVN